MNRISDYLKESRAELSRVSWPTRAEAAKLTVAVILFTIGFSAIIGGLDWVFSQILQKIILKG